MLFASPVAQVGDVMRNLPLIDQASRAAAGHIAQSQFLGNSLSVARDGSLGLADQLGEARHSRMRPPLLMKV